jgi:uncharacterized protein involved in outer membrane biogenesis
MDGIFQAAATWAGSIVAGLLRRRWLRRMVATVLIILIIYTVGGFFGLPYALRRVLTGQVASSLKRPVTVGVIAFNPYRLRLEVNDLHVADRDPQQHFVDLKKLRVKVSWSSLWRLAPIVGEFYTDGLIVHVVRTGEQTFNFSDLLSKSANAPAPAPAANQKPSGPPRFAVSNIQLNDGEIDFEDQTLHQQHRVEHLRLAVPFIANLPSDVDIFVQPFLQMIIDGSRFRLTGYTKPFGQSLDTIVNFSLHRLALAPYVAYVPMKLPVKLADGMLSMLIQLHFRNANAEPQISLDGGAALEQVDVRDGGGAPLLAVGRTVVTLDSVRPLESVAHLKRIYIEGLDAHLVRNADGTMNVSALAASSPSKPVVPRSTPTALATPAVAIASPTPTPTSPLAAQMQLTAPAPTPAPPSGAPTPKGPLDFALDSFEMADSAVDLTDRSQPTPAVLALKSVRARLDQLRTVGGGLSPFEMSANVASGGGLAVKGKLDLAQRQATTDATLNKIDLAALKGFAARVLNCDLTSGALTAQASVKSSFAPNKFNVHVEPATASIENLVLKDAPGPKEPPNPAEPLGWDKFAISLAQLDLATQQAVVNEIRADRLRIAVKRDHHGTINLLTLVKQPGAQANAVNPPHAPGRRPRSARRERAELRRERAGVSRAGPAPKAASATAPTPGGWKYHVLAVVLDKAEIHLLDERGAKPVKLDVVPLQLNVKDVSDDLSKPIGVEVDGIVNSKGSFRIEGTAAPQPLETKLKVTTKRLDLSPANAYLGDRVNATLASALLSMNGTTTAAKHGERLRAGYRGDITLGRVRVRDKLTGDDFVRWNSFSAQGISAEYGQGPPKVRIRGLALAKFYARVILRSNGTLNLKDITSNPRAARVSLTRPGYAGPPVPAPSPAAAATPTAAATPAAAAPPAPQPLPAAIDIGGITLQGGHVNYTDNFIEPHYSADLVDVGGKIGAFGTGSTQPAEVALEGQLNGNAPLAINGSVNPLTPMAYINIGAKADGVELPGLSTYSAKFTGYPIVKGTLTVDVHYLLDNRNLTATNHIVINQLTFGDRVQNKAVINLPIRLAVAVLKDPHGVIDLKIPVSGSLNDPQFSIAGVIWQVLKNLVLKAVTAPFNLIAGLFGGGDSGQNLNYIVFAPGYAQITAEAEKQLDTIAKALSERPALKLNITGRVDPRVDRDGLRMAKVDRQVLAQEIQGTDESEGTGTVTVGQDGYDKYLKKAYKAAKFDKPRNVVGLTKSLPPAEMKKLMAENEKITDNDLRQLGDARGDAVRTALTKRKIDPARLFVLPPKLNADDIKEGKTTRAELSLD